MTVGDLVVRLLFHDLSLPVVFRGPQYAADIPVEITAVERQAYIPHDGIAAREDVVVITADPDR